MSDAGKQKLHDSLDELHRHRHSEGAKVLIPVLPPELRKQLPELPAGVHIRDRELAIEYDTLSNSCRDCTSCPKPQPETSKHSSRS